MKYIASVCLVLFPAFILAQTNLPSDSIARIKLDDLMDSWTLGINGTDEVDLKTYNKFKRLFSANATVDDDFNVFYRYDPKTKSGSYKINTSSKPPVFYVYAHNVALQIKSILIDSIAVLASDTKDQKNMTFTVRRRVEIHKKRQYVLPDSYANEVSDGRTIEFEDKTDSLKMVSNLKTKIGTDQEAIYTFISVNTVRISMALETDTVRITNIKSVINDVTCTNDADNDAVLNHEDSQEGQAGDFSASGMPDYDLDGVPDKNDKCKFSYGQGENHGCPLSYFLTKNKFDGFVGFQLNTVKLNLPELNQLGYLNESGGNAMDVLQSKKGSLKSSGMAPGIYAGANFTYYFGHRKKQFGISAGFNYTEFTNKYLLTSPIVYTYKSYDGVHFYRRQITIDSVHEAIRYNIFNFPVVFNYRTHLGKKDKFLINLKAGPSLMLFSNVSDYRASIDLGGLYQIDTIQKNKITYYDYFSPSSTYNIFLTTAKINAQNRNPGAVSIFEQLNAKNYDFTSNKSFSGTQKSKRMTVAFNIDIALQYKIAEGITLKAGPHFIYAPMPQRTEKYKPIDKTTDVYRSIYYSNAKSSYSAFGVNAGFVYDY